MQQGTPEAAQRLFSRSAEEQFSQGKTVDAHTALKGLGTSMAYKIIETELALQELDEIIA